MNSESDTSTAAGAGASPLGASNEAIEAARQAVLDAQRRAIHNIAAAQSAAQESIRRTLEGAASSSAGVASGMGVSAEIAKEVERSVQEARTQVEEAQAAMKTILDSALTQTSSVESGARDAPPGTSDSNADAESGS